MNRFSFLLILTLTLLFSSEGCRNANTSPSGNSNTSGWIEATSNAPWASRYGLAGANFSGNMWVIGGASGSAAVTNSSGVTTSAPTTQFYGDVWKSSDGKNWSKTATPSFGGRYGSQVVTFASGGVTQLYLIAGNASGTLMNDVWSSPDGTNWTQILANNPGITSRVIGGAQFSPREDFCAVVFNNLIWVIGGADNVSSGSAANDVWSSPDGITWTQVLTDTPNLTYAQSTTQPEPRWGSAAVSFNNNIYWMCGHDSVTNNTATVASDIWSTANGSTWVKVSDNFGPVYYHQLVTNNNAMWFTCGNNPQGAGVENFVESSTNWTSWVSPGTIPFPARYGHLSLSFNNQVWVMGGVDNLGSLTFYNDVWHSP